MSPGLRARRLATAAALQVLVACGSVPTVVRVGTYLDPAGSYPMDRALAAVLAAFQGRNPELRVEIEVGRWDTMADLFIVAGRHAVDLQWVPAEDLAKTTAAAGDLSSLWTGDGDLLWQRPGERTGFLQPDVHGLIAREPLFAGARIENLGELVAWAALLTRYDDVLDIDRYGLGIPLRRESEGAPVLAALGGPEALFRRDVGQVRSLAALRQMTIRPAILHPDAPAHGLEEVYTAFRGGTFAAVYGSTGRMERLRRETVVADPWDVQFLPFPGAPAVVQGWHLAIRRGARREARDLATFLLGPEADELWVTVGRQVPLRRSTVRRLAGWLAERENRYLAVAAAMAPGWRPRDTPLETGWEAQLRLMANRTVVETTPIARIILDSLRQSTGR